MTTHAVLDSKNHSGFCGACSAKFTKKRLWHAFCSPKCRKQAWVISHRTGVYTDVRNDIATIKADVAAIMKILSDQWREHVPY